MAMSETEAAREMSAAGGAAGEGHGGSGEGGGSHGHGAAHASNRFYLIIAAVLAVLTALEVMVFYVPALDAVLVPILMVMMIAKFALVVMFFMHLKYDSAVLTGLFVGPLVIAVAIIVAMMALFGQFA
jgi:caa(3)-type oxidase subunit IV